jgi:hypothetical protein
MTFLGFTVAEWTAITNGALTLGLLFFAGMQWWVTREGERARAKERRDDEAAKEREADRAADLAFQAVWAEQFRLEGLADDWEESDLVLLSSMGALQASDLLPRDWVTIVRSLSQLSVEAGILGAVALSLAYKAEREVAKLNGIVAQYRQQYHKEPNTDLVQVIRHNRGDELSVIEARIKEAARDLSKVFWDAARHYPRADIDRGMRFRDDMLSTSGKSAAEALVTRAHRRQLGSKLPEVGN